MPYRLYAEDPEWRARALEDNRRMLEAIRSGDINAAHEVVDHEFAGGAQLLIEHLEKAGVWDESRDAGAEVAAEA